VALVTGGARGQGAAHVHRLAAEGCSVIAADVLDNQGAEHTGRLAEQGYRVAYRHLDVSDAQQWQTVVADIIDRHGRLDVLVNNAGIIHVTPLEQEQLAAWEQLMSVNLTGTFLGIQAVTPVMRSAGTGSIINVASIFGPAGAPGYAAYSASKAGILGLTRTAAVELIGDGIRVNAITPGGVATPMNEEETEGGVIRQTPIRRRANPPEISAAVAFLASADASFVTGSNMVVDGGFLAH
jgi:NAD(P)-dependent dehydrogenase (short-subunit alcohol dehydrogenase family)